jgi:hypothetical protein
MTTNLNVNSVGLPAATPAARAPTPAADESVPTQLPPNRSVVALENGGATRMDARGAGTADARQIMFDRAAAMMVYQVVDKRSGTVLQQFPEEAVLRRRAYFRTLDAMRDASAEPPRVNREA